MVDNDKDFDLETLPAMLERNKLPTAVSQSMIKSADKVIALLRKYLGQL